MKYRKGTVVTWGPLAVVLGALVVGLAIAVVTIALVEHGIMVGIDHRSTIRDAQLCEQAGLDQAVEAFLPPRERDRARDFVFDVQQHDPACTPPGTPARVRPGHSPSPARTGRLTGSTAAPVTPPTPAPAASREPEPQVSPRPTVTRTRRVVVHRTATPRPSPSSSASCPLGLPLCLKRPARLLLSPSPHG